MLFCHLLIVFKISFFEKYVQRLKSLFQQNKMNFSFREKAFLVGRNPLTIKYADDTQSFLNGSENSLRETLDILKFFYTISGF